jgi:hypothetical protein
VIAFVFAYRVGKAGSPGRSYYGYLASGVLIVVSGVIALFNFQIGRFSSIWLGEVLALLSFGVAWFVNGEGIRFISRKPHLGTA